MRTTKWLCFLSYRQDGYQELRKLLQSGIISDYCLQVHDKDVLEDGTPKEWHAHGLIKPNIQFDTRVWAERTKEPNGLDADGHPLYNYLFRFQADPVCYNLGTWYGYSVLHDPSLVKDDSGEKYPYNPNAAFYGSAATQPMLAQLWSECEVYGVDEDPEIVKKLKAKEAQKVQAREKLRTVYQMAEAGHSLPEIQYALGTIDVCTRTAIMDAIKRYQGNNSDAPSAHEYNLLKDRYRALQESYNKLQKYADDLKDELAYYHNMRDNEATREGFQMLEALLRQNQNHETVLDNFHFEPLQDDTEFIF